MVQRACALRALLHRKWRISPLLFFLLILMLLQIDRSFPQSDNDSRRDLDGGIEWVIHGTNRLQHRMPIRGIPTQEVSVHFVQEISPRCVVLGDLVAAMAEEKLNGAKVFALVVLFKRSYEFTKNPRKLTVIRCSVATPTLVDFCVTGE
jgi:hypothetical protein